MCSALLGCCALLQMSVPYIARPLFMSCSQCLCPEIELAPELALFIKLCVLVPCLSLFVRFSAGLRHLLFDLLL